MPATYSLDWGPAALIVKGQIVSLALRPSRPLLNLFHSAFVAAADSECRALFLGNFFFAKTGDGGFADPSGLDSC